MNALKIRSLGAVFLFALSVSAASPRQNPTDKQVAAGKELIRAIRRGDDDRARTLIADGASLNAHDPTGDGTALEAALLAGKLEIAKLLLDRGARVNEPGVRSDTPLMTAIRTGNRAAVDLVLSRNPPLETINKDGENPLIVAAGRGDAETVAALLSRKASVSSADAEGGAPLMHAARAGSASCVKLLLEAHAAPNAADKRGRTALMETRGPEAKPILEALRANGADVDTHDKYGCTALMIAAKRGEITLASELIDRSADITVKDTVGRTALDRAAAAGSEQIVVLLQRRNPVKLGELAGRDALVREVVAASIAQMEASSARFRKAVGGRCFSCHNQSQVQFALKVARDRGFKVGAGAVADDMSAVAALYDKCGPKLTKAFETKKVGAAESKLVSEAFPGGATHIGYGLLGLYAWDPKPSANAEAVARYLVHMQKGDGRWRSQCDVRAPAEKSDFTETALAIFALKKFVTPAHAPDVQAAVASGRKWLAEAQPKTTEDRAFRLLGLFWADDSLDSPQLRQARDALLRDQRADGGWAQETGLASDAYATGESLVALHLATGLSPADPVFRRGVEFLLRDVEEDGTWFVRSRSVPFQGYIETGYPGGQHQFISITAATWATTALALTRPLEQARR